MVVLYKDALQTDKKIEKEFLDLQAKINNKKSFNIE